jgi:hypothetical protein
MSMPICSPGHLCQCGRDHPWTAADIKDFHRFVQEWEEKAAELSLRLRWKSRIALLCLT